MDPPANKKQKLSHRKKTKYFQINKKKRYLEVGQRGFLATCNFNEKNCIRDCYNILNHYANELYGPDERNIDKKNENESATKQCIDNDDDDHGHDDIVDDLQKQIDATKQQRCNSKLSNNSRFQVVDTGATNCIFVTTTLDDPIQLGMHIIKDVAAKKEQRSRHLLRFIPIERVCKANVKDILDTAGLLADKYLLKQSTTFAVIYKKRYNNAIQMDGLIKELAELIHQKNALNKVNLDNPKKSLIVEIIKGLCCMSIIDDYKYYKKYNISELCLNTKYNNDDGNELCPSTKRNNDDANVDKTKNNLSDEELTKENK